MAELFLGLASFCPDVYKGTLVGSFVMAEVVEATKHLQKAFSVFMADNFCIIGY